MLYKTFRARTDAQFKVYISYLEIYNDKVCVLPFSRTYQDSEITIIFSKGYDLLDPSHETKALEDMPKISLLEDEHGNFHLKNLSMHPAESEEEALNLLFMGDTNRAIAETPMNMVGALLRVAYCTFDLIRARAHRHLLAPIASSRSH